MAGRNTKPEDGCMISGVWKTSVEVSNHTGDSDALCMTGRWLYADSGHALPARVAPVPVGCDEVLPSNAEGAQVRKHRADQHGTRAAACDNRVQIADHFGCYRAAERGEHTERCANRRSLLIER